MLSLNLTKEESNHFKYYFMHLGGKYMRKSKAFKVAVGFASATILMSVFSMTAHAEDQGVAGISYTLDNYISAIAMKEDKEDSQTANLSLEEIISPYANLGVSIAGSYVNVRKDPSTDSEVVGKLYKGSAADILRYLEGDWVEIESGDVKGYIASNYLAIGKQAEAMVDDYAKKYATVTTKTLNVREKQNTDSKIFTQIPEGETYVVVNEYEEWAEILLGTDEDTGKDFTGFVSKEFVNIKVEFKFAISIEEENRILKEQAEAQERAERAERERKQKLAEEQARKAEEARRAAEAKASNEEVQERPSSGSKDVSSLQQEIATYALQFVGNRYVWGGDDSLTGGVDCSGFTMLVYRAFGYTIPRVSRDQAVNAGRRVDVSDRQPGDLIFYTNSSGTVNHVALYIGNNKIVHAANSREGIKVSQYNYREVYRIRRIVN